MKHRIFLLLLCSLFINANTLFAQVDKSDREERKSDLREKYQERTSKAKEKVDYNVFRRQILGLKEYADERKKIPALQKASKMSVKIVAYVDSLEGDEGPTLTGYIQQNIGDNSINVYELTYDRAAKKIVSVKPTGETSEFEAEEKTTEPKKTITKKKVKGDDDEEEEPEERKTKTKYKEKDDDE